MGVMTLLGDDSAMDSDLLMMMMMGGQGGMGQMNPLMLSMLLDDSSDKVDAAKLKKTCDDLDGGAEKTTCESNYNLVINPITKLEHDCTATDATATCADNKMLMLMMMQGGNMGAMNPLLMMSLLE